MDRNFARALSAVLRHEGGYVDLRADPGGATNMGVTIGTARAIKLDLDRDGDVDKADIKLVTKDDAAKVYKAHYWDRLSGDALPSGVDYAVFDFAVNSGVSRAAIFLQEIVGVAPDGRIGPLTLAAVAEWDSARLIGELCARRMAFLKRLSTWPTFGKGWSARVTGVLRLAKDMAMTMPSAPAHKPKPAPAPTAPATPKSPLAALAVVLGALIAAAYAFLRSKGIMP